MKTFLLAIILTINIISEVVGQSSPIADFTCDTLSTTPYCCLDFMDLSSNAPTYWHWEFGDGVTSFLQNPTHCFPAPGIYQVMLIAANPTGSDTISMAISAIACVCPVSVGLNEFMNTSSSVKVRPNPFSETTTLVSESDLKDATLSIYTTYGSRVEVFNGIFGREFVLNRANLTSGIYFAHLDQGNMVVSINKVIVIDN